MKNILGIILLLVLQANAKDYICYYPKSCENFNFYSDGEVKNWIANYKIMISCVDVGKVYKNKYNLTYKIKNSGDIRLNVIPIKKSRNNIQCFFKKK